MQTPDGFVSSSSVNLASRSLGYGNCARHPGPSVRIARPAGINGPEGKRAIRARGAFLTSSTRRTASHPARRGLPTAHFALGSITRRPPQPEYRLFHHVFLLRVDELPLEHIRLEDPDHRALRRRAFELVARLLASLGETQGVIGIVPQPGVMAGAFDARCEGRGLYRCADYVCGQKGIFSRTSAVLPLAVNFAGHS